jgi:hypothetical protein
MPRPPRHPDAEALRQARDGDLVAGGLRRVFSLSIEEWVARAPWGLWDAPAGVIAALWTRSRRGGGPSSRSGPTR